MSGSTTQMTAAQLQAQNAQISSLVRSVGLEVFQPIYSGQITPAATPVLNVPIRNVGLVRGFLVEIIATLNNAGTAAAALTDFGPANLLSNVSFTDLDGYQRINTTGWHINALNTAKEGRPFGSAELATATDSPVNYGNNGAIITAPASIAAAANATVKMMFWVPLAYSKTDLRGAIFAGVVNATAFLALTPNPQMGATVGDNTLAVYSGANTNVTCTSMNVTISQSYIDQLPRYTTGAQAGAPILPPTDIATQYKLMNTSLTGLSVGQDFPIPFSNFQEFLSATIIYDQAGTRNAGTDINYFTLAAANTLQIFKRGAASQMLMHRLRIKTDLPKGMYAFDFRDAPISTNQSGNMQLNLNPSSAAAGSQVLIGFESFALTNSVLGAASLPSS